jgi:hypothetical protein
MARAATKTKTKTVEVEEDVEDELDEDVEDVEEVDDDDLILDDDEDDDTIEEVVKAKPSKAKRKTQARQEITFGVRDLCDWLTEHNEAGKVYQPKDVRNLIRKMAREDNPRVERDIVAGNKSRYDWPDGLKDPEVKRIVKAVQKGEIESARKEQLDALKERKAAKEAAAGGKSKSKAKQIQKAAATKVLDEDDDEDFEDDDED